MPDTDIARTQPPVPAAPPNGGAPRPDTTTTRAKQTTPHLYYLDWLRTLVVYAVFFGHVFLPFTGGAWLITSGRILPISLVVALLGNQFAMPLMFLVAGAAVWFSLRRRSGRTFIRERVQRLIVPYFVFVAVLSPLQAYYEAVHHRVYDGSFIGYLPIFFSLSRFTCCDLSWAGAYGYHLWYLVFLFAFSVVALPLFLYLRRPAGARWIDACARLALRRGGLLVLALPVVLSQILLRANYGSYQSWADFAFWGSYFVFGFLFIADDRFAVAVQRDRKLMLWTFIATTVGLLALGIAAALGIINLAGTEGIGQVMVQARSTALAPGVLGVVFTVYSVFFLLFTLNSWSLVLLLLSLAKRHLDRPIQSLVYPGQIAMPFYLLHHPVVVIVAFYVVRLYINPRIEALILTTSALLITLGTIEYFVMPYNPVRMLMGLRPLAAHAPRTRLFPHVRLLYQQVAFFVAALAFIGLLGLGMNNPDPDPKALLGPPSGWALNPTAGDTLCADGSPYQFLTRQNINNRQLVIYFQTGGVCWDAESCGPNSILYDRTVEPTELNTYGGIFDFRNSENPLTNYDFAFIPYCTGDLHTGQADVTYTTAFGSQFTIRHRGAVNARAVLDWVYAHYPTLDRVVIIGTSAGVIGSLYFTDEIVNHYPTAEVMQFGDGLVGVMPEGWDGTVVWNSHANLPPDLQTALADVPADQFIPALYQVTAQRHPALPLATYTTAADAFQIVYYGVAGGDVREWAPAMNAQLATLRSTIPTFHSFVESGTRHTVLALPEFYTAREADVRVRDWFADLVASREVEDVNCVRGSITCP